jgi:TonB family protein
MPMRLPILAVCFFAVVHPVHAAAQRTSPDMAGDTVPVSAVVVDENDMVDVPKPANRSTIERLLSQNYPRDLRATGRTGSVTVTMVIDPTGVPRLVTVTGSSGNREFDDAALRVSRAMRFSQPVLNGSPVWVRARVPVMFRLQN